MTRRVAVTGLGAVTPCGVGVEEFWDQTTSGVSHTRHEPSMTAMGLRSHVVASLDAFDVAEHHDAAEAAELRRLSRFVQFGTTAGAHAIADGGLPDSRIDPDRGGVVCSSAIGGTPEFQDTYEEITDAGRHAVRALPPDSRFYDSVFLNYTPAWVARVAGLGGPTTSLTTGCTAGVDAFGLGFDLVSQGELDVVVAGAAEAPLSGLAYATLAAIGSLAQVDGPAATASRPFDLRRGGFVLAEGAAAVVLEDLDHARARGVHVYAEVLGFASGNNAHHMTDLAPDGNAMADVICQALRTAGVVPREIDYVNAHGSSTPQNDVFETRAFKQVFGAYATEVPISSTKSMIGHSLSSASLVGVLAALGAIRRSVVPPTINYEVPDPDCDLDYVPNRARPHDVRTAALTASGFGGIHSCAVLRRLDPSSGGGEPS